MLLALLACSHPNPATGDTASCADTGACMQQGLTLSAGSTRDLPAAVTVPHEPVAIVVGDLAGAGTAQVYVGTNRTLTRLDGKDWATATNIWSQADDGKDVVPLLADLTGDGVLDLALALLGSDGGSGQVVVFPGPITDPLSWDVPHFELKGTAGAGEQVLAADIDGDGVVDLVAREGNTVWIRPGPVSADLLFGAAGDGAWTSTSDATIQDVAVGDVDGDGQADLVFTVELLTDDCPQPSYGVRVALGPLSDQIRTIDEAPIALAAPDAAPWGSILVADANDDGVDDVFSASWDTSYRGAESGTALLYWGPLVDGQTPAARIGVIGPLLGLADLDGDGVDDLLQKVAFLPQLLLSKDIYTWVGQPTLLSGPIADLPSWDTDACIFSLSQAWNVPDDFGWVEASWVGELDGDGDGDGDGMADAILASTGDDELGLVSIVRSKP